MSAVVVILEALISPGPLASKISFVIVSELLFKARDLTFKTGFRYGDNAPMAVIEFVDRDVEAKKIDKKKTEKSKPIDKKEDAPKEATA